MDLADMYRDIVETSPDGIWVIGLDGETLYANAGMAALLRRDLDEMLAVRHADCLDAVGKIQYAEHLVDLRRGRLNSSDVECLLHRSDGSTIWVLIRESPLHEVDGTLTGVICRITDYTERRSLVDGLEHSRQQLAEAQQIVRMGSWEWDVVRDEILGSAGLSAVYGRDYHSLPVTYAFFLSGVHPDERALVDETVRRSLREGEPFDYEARVAVDDGWIWTRGRGLPVLDGSGRVVSVSGTTQDISRTKEAETVLTDLVLQNTLMQAMASAANESETFDDVLQVARGLILAHDDWDRARGFLPAEDGATVTTYHLLREDRDVDAADPAITAVERRLAERVLAERGILWDEVGFEGRPMVGFPVLLGGDVVLIVIITSSTPFERHDMIASMIEQAAVQMARVAEREHAARELATARDAAMEASRQKSEFLATMSHEIRTPLNGVIGLTDLLLRTDLDDAQHRLASGVQLAGRALLAVINDVLDFSKIEAGRLELEHLDFEVRAVFDQVASVLGAAARAKGIELVVACHADVPVVMASDPTRLAQVLSNLGSNAVKFTEKGEVHIEATVTSGEQGDVLRVEVSDTGIGITDDQMKLIFDPFAQADASTTRRFGGTGLGLAISSEIVRALGGELGVTSVPGEGSTFWFTTPLHAPARERISHVDEDTRERLAGLRVLLVDDIEHNRLLLTEQLGWWDLRSHGVVSTEEALEALAEAVASEDPFNLVLLDMAMPGSNGLDLAHAVRRIPAYDRIPLVMLSSSLPPEPALLRAAGIAGCLSKPLLAGALRALLLRTIGGESSHAEPETVLSRHRILVVEDNAVNQMVAMGLLEALGHDVDTVDDGLDAVAALQREEYDLVLMDLQMPRMDGYAATREIRENELPDRRTPILAMTASVVVGERDRCLAAGMDDFLTKPVDPTVLREMLDRWLGGPGRPARSTPAPGPAARIPVPAGRGDDLDLDRLDMLCQEASPVYLDRAITNFVASSTGALEDVRAAVEAADSDQLRHTAHRLKGSALNLGLPRVAGPALHLEQVGDTGTVAGAVDLLPVLQEALDAGRRALLAYQDQLSLDPSSNEGEPG